MTKLDFLYASFPSVCFSVFVFAFDMYDALTPFGFFVMLAVLLFWGFVLVSDMNESV